MSEAENQATSILLPSSGVAVYSRDKTTIVSAQAIGDDWRFARVDLQVQDGDIETAIAAYQDAPSPDMVIVQTDTVDESFTGRLEALAAHCSEGTAAIVIGPENDVYLYRQMIEMGVSDYLVKPVETSILADVIAKAVIEKIGATGSRLVAFVGAKGGVGTSVIAQSLAWAVSETLGQKTILLDGSGGWSTLGVGMGFEPSTTLAEAVRASEKQDEDSLARMLFKASDNLNVLASGGDAMLEQSITPAQYEHLLDMLMVKYPVVMVDLSASVPDLKNVVLARANEVVLVSTATLPALRLARSLLQEMKEIRGGSDEGIEMVVNMQGLAPANEVSKGDIENAMEFKPSAMLPFDPKLFIGTESEGRKLIDDKVGNALVHNVLLPVLQRVLAADIEGTQVVEEQSKGGLGGLITKITRKA